MRTEYRFTFVLSCAVVRALLPLGRAVVVEELARLAGDRVVLLAQQLVLRLQRSGLG